MPAIGMIGFIVSPVSGTVAARGTSSSIIVVVSFSGLVGALKSDSGTSSSSTVTFGVDDGSGDAGASGTSSSKISKGVDVGASVLTTGVGEGADVS